MKKESIILEIRSAEGGMDSKLIVEDMKDIYIRACRINEFDQSIFESRVGFISI